MKKIIKLLLVLLLLPLSSCTDNRFDTHWTAIVCDKIYSHYGHVCFLSLDGSYGCTPNRNLDDVNFNKHRINYVLSGDEFTITSKTCLWSLQCGEIASTSFEKVYKVKVKRAPLVEFEIQDNGTKEIVCIDDDITINEKFADPEQIIYTDQYFHIYRDPGQIFLYEQIENDYSLLSELEVGTKLMATVYETEEGYGVYSFYLKSFIDEVVK